MVKHARSGSRSDRRVWLSVVAAVVLVVTAVGVRTAEALQRLHATAGSSQPHSTPRPASTGHSRTAHRRAPAGRAAGGSPARNGRPRLRRASLTARIATHVDSPNSVSVAALDLTTGRRFDYGPTSGMIDASVSKLDILEALLLHQQRAHTPMTAEDDQLATAMIEHSDNSAGQTLWNELGYAPGIAAANRHLGLRHTVPDPAGYYGLTTSGAGDQLALLDDLVDRHGPLTRTSRAYALALVADVEADQRWGVSAAADPGSRFAVKNGWMPIDDDNGRWVVNSDGIITSSGHRLLIAIMTRHDVTEQDGIALVESISRLVARALR